MPTPEPAADHRPEELLEEEVEEVSGTEVVHPDPTTKREGMEQELIEEGRSEDGADIGEHVD